MFCKEITLNPFLLNFTLLDSHDIIFSWFNFVIGLSDSTFYFGPGEGSTFIGWEGYWGIVSIISMSRISKNQTRGNLLHSVKQAPLLFQACKFSLRSVTNVLEAEKTKVFVNQHLIDDASLHYQEFITDLSKLLVCTCVYRLLLI